MRILPSFLLPFKLLISPKAFSAFSIVKIYISISLNLQRNKDVNMLESAEWNIVESL